MARYYQQKLNAPNIDDTYVVTQQGAHENNSKSNELTNAVVSGGLTPSVEDIIPPNLEDTKQLAQALYVASVTGRAFSIIGGSTASLYKVNPIGNLEMPPGGTGPGEGYHFIAGAFITFVAQATNVAGAELEIVPKPPGVTYGPKPILTDTLSPVGISAGQIVAGRRYQFYYDPGFGVDGAWLLVQQYRYSANPVTLITFEKPSGTSGGSITTGGWRLIPLSDIGINEIGIAPLISSTFVLNAGKYNIVICAVANDISPARLRLRDTLTGQADIYGMNGGGYETVGSDDNPYCYLDSVLEFSGTRIFTLEIRAANSSVNIGNLGNPCSISGLRERYATVRLEKIG